MRNMNQDLQATHDILMAIEKSKINLENLVENLPGFFGVVNLSGDILLGNITLAKALNVDFESIIRSNIFNIMSNTDAEIFKGKLRLCAEDSSDEYQVFELPIRHFGIAQPKAFLWYLFRFPFETAEGLLVSFYGTDISELRNSEKKLREIFTTIPIGILTLSEGGVIDDKYSSYSEILLKSEQLAGKKFLDVLFSDRADKYMSAQVNSIEQMETIYGKDENYFFTVSKDWPKECSLTKADSNGVMTDYYLGVMYHGIFLDGKVSKILVVVEDRTNAMIAEKAKEKMRLLEDSLFKRVLSVKKVDPEVLVVMRTEVSSLISKSKKSIETRDKVASAHNLHALKGNFRVLEFDALARSVHELEEFVTSVKPGEQVNWTEIERHFDLILKEWTEIEMACRLIFKEQQEFQSTQKNDANNSKTEELKKLLESYQKSLLGVQNFEKFVLSEQLYNAIQEAGYSELQDVESITKFRVESTARKLNKLIDVECHWEGVKMSRLRRTELSECLLHMVNNAIDHGLEDAEERIKKGKSGKGKLVIKGFGEGGSVTFSFSDDGRGISLEHIKNTAVAKGVIKLEDSYQMDEASILKLIYAPGFSTAVNVSEISGRGVGLSSVAEIVKKNKSVIDVVSSESEGTTFTFSLLCDEIVECKKQVFKFADFVLHLKSGLQLLQKHFPGFSAELSIDPIVSEGKLLIFVDLRRLVLALISTLEQLIVEGSIAGVRVTFHKSVFEFHLLHANGVQKIGIPEKRNPIMLGSKAEEILKQHGVIIPKNLSSPEHVVKMLILLTGVPVIKIGLNSSLSENDVEIVNGYLKEVEKTYKLNFDIKNGSSESLDLIIRPDGVIEEGPSISVSSSMGLVEKEIFQVIEKKMKGL